MEPKHELVVDDAKHELVVDDARLQNLRARPSLPAYLTSLWQRRHFIWADARRRAFSRGRDMYLGRAWLVLQPLLDSLVYVLIFGVILKLSRNIEHFIGYLVIGVIFYGFMNRGISNGSGLIQSSKGMIASFSFPIASIPVSVVSRQLLDNIPPALVGMVIAMTVHQIVPSVSILAVIPLYLMIHAFSLGLMFVVARITAFIPDAKALVSTFLRALFFISGVFFDIHRFDANETIQSIMLANPIFQFLTAVREATIYQSFPPVDRWLYLLLWTIGTLSVGLVFFWRAEDRYINVK